MNARAISVWAPEGGARVPGLEELIGEMRGRGGAAGLAAYMRGRPHCRTAYAHGERHDLWWEFALSASFRWQAHLWRLPPEAARQRTYRLAAELGLLTLLNRPVEALTAAQRARANLAVALLPGPDLLIWEEPCCLLSRGETARVSRFLRSLVRDEELTVVAVSADPLGLQRLELPPLRLLGATTGNLLRGQGA